MTTPNPFNDMTMADLDTAPPGPTEDVVIVERHAAPALPSMTATPDDTVLIDDAPVSWRPVVDSPAVTTARPDHTPATAWRSGVVAVSANLIVALPMTMFTPPLMLGLPIVAAAALAGVALVVAEHSTLADHG